jgi:hypothetical protein
MTEFAYREYETLTALDHSIMVCVFVEASVSCVLRPLFSPLAAMRWVQLC